MHVVDLPGHIQPGASRRIWNRLGDYMEHLDNQVSQIDGPVVLVGHSMGGLVTQRVLERRTVAAAVLVASAPRRGVAGAVARLARRDPKRVAASLTSLSMWPFVADDDAVRAQLFSDATPADVVAATGAKLQNESYPAFISMLFRWPRPKRVITPILVIAAVQDALFTLAEQADLADAYQAPIERIEAGHNLMLEPSWPELVEHISTWTREHVAN